MISLAIRQGLHQRHIQMIALAGAIGSKLTRSAFLFFFFFFFFSSASSSPHRSNIGPNTSLPAGLFLGSGKAIAQAGPLGAFLGYT